MLMIVFGAGASYDSVPAFPPGLTPEVEEQFRPPLANGLFENRGWFASILSKYPECRPIVPLLRDLKGASIELVLQELQNEAENKYPKGLQQLAAVRFYLQDLLWNCGGNWNARAQGITNYISLLDEIERHRQEDEEVCITTFNYDNLIELALQDLGIYLVDFASYVQRSKYKLIKIHGSVNWARRISTKIDSLKEPPDTVRREIISRAAELTVTDEYVIISSHSVVAEQTGALFPAIAIPVETKTDFECPRDHLNALTELIPKVDRILVVGWRATDNPFLSLLKNRLARKVRGVVVNGKIGDGKSAIGRLIAAGIDGDFTAVDGGFSDFVVRREFRLVLS
jgi:hypothetical protein